MRAGIGPAPIVPKRSEVYIYIILFLGQASHVFKYHPIISILALESIFDTGPGLF